MTVAQNDPKDEQMAEQLGKQPNENDNGDEDAANRLQEEIEEIMDY